MAPWKTLRTAVLQAVLGHPRSVGDVTPEAVTYGGAGHVTPEAMTYGYAAEWR